MSMLTGKQIMNRKIINRGLWIKYDNGIVPSYGMDGMGYTLRCDLIEDCILVPGTIVRMKSYESVNMPTDCGALLYIKSTYARKGIMLITNSPIDPSYHGLLSLNLYNASDEPVLINMLGGIAMLVVWQMSEPGEVYSGRWQGDGINGINH